MVFRKTLDTRWKSKTVPAKSKRIVTLLKAYIRISKLIEMVVIVKTLMNFYD